MATRRRSANPESRIPNPGYDPVNHAVVLSALFVAAMPLAWRINP
jgi:hypothetical protein